jgi:PTH2 family peptidyl-tRNA hydrolase
METKQVIVIRKDLKMRTGKLAAQVAHASMAAVITNYLTKTDEVRWIYTPTSEIREWLNESFTKICVYVNSEEELIAIYDKAKSKDLPCSLIKDIGKTEFHGIPTYTSVAVGPGLISRIDEVTGGLPLF